MHESNGYNGEKYFLFSFSPLHNKIKKNRTKSNQRWMKLRTTVQLSSAIQKKPPLKREDSFLKRFSTRQIPETQVILMENSIIFEIKLLEMWMDGKQDVILCH